MAEAKADSLTELRQVWQAKATADSLRLDSVQAVSYEREAELEQAREAARARALGARRSADSAQAALRATLESLGASTDALDALETAHAAEIEAVMTERVAADSLAAVRLTLLRATEAALASERQTRQAALAEVGALGDQIRALESSRRRGRVVSGLVVAGAIAVVVLR